MCWSKICQKKAFKHETTRVGKPLELIHSDLTDFKSIEIDEVKGIYLLQIYVYVLIKNKDEANNIPKRESWN